MTTSSPLIFYFKIIPYEIFTQCFPLINQSLQENLGSVYLESIEGGFLYICSDYKTFLKLHEDLPEEIKKRIADFPIDQKQTLSPEDLLMQQNFPTKGIDLIIQPKNSLSIKAMPVFTSYYSKLHPDITTKVEESDRTVVHFHSYDAWKFQIRLIYESLLIAH